VPLVRVPPAGTATTVGSRAGRTPAREAAAARVAGSVAVMVLADVQRHARAWAWWQLVKGPQSLGTVPGLGFAKVLGSGAGGGFGLWPSGTHRGLFMVFHDEAVARRFLATSPVLAAWRAHARESCVALLRACSSKGSWDGTAMAVTADAPGAGIGEEPGDGPIVALTRASIHARHAWAFWRLSPPAERDLQAAAGCHLAVGLGEAPLLRQATFSVWRNAAAMDAYARGGAHQRAIRSAYGGGYFSEAMFVRFRPLLIDGSWPGLHAQNHG
jgi:spheroidene monooxygenase